MNIATKASRVAGAKKPLDIKRSPRFVFAFCFLALAANYCAAQELLATSGDAMSARAPEPIIAANASFWEDGIGSGLRKGTKEVVVAAGLGNGMASFGSTQAHDLALGQVSIGRVLTDIVGAHRWYRGNFEGSLEAFGGGQYHPRDAYVFGLTPVLRYSFATGSRWVPFGEIGAGISGTDIRHPDLSTKFEFNLQAGVGCHYFLKENLALSLKYRFLHLSNAGLDHPNHGVNAGVVYLGVTRLF